MPKIEFTKDYKFAHGGVRIEDYVVGQSVDATDELAECALADKVAHRSTPLKAARKAPENVAASVVPEIKSK